MSTFGRLNYNSRFITQLTKTCKTFLGFKKDCYGRMEKIMSRGFFKIVKRYFWNHLSWFLLYVSWHFIQFYVSAIVSKYITQLNGLGLLSHGMVEIWHSIAKCEYAISNHSYKHSRIKT